MVAVLALVAALAAAEPPPLPLGPARLEEKRVVHTLAGGVRWTHVTRRGHGGPFRIDVLEVPGDRDLRALTGHDRTPGLERPSAMARRHDAIAGVNGGYFAGAAPDAGDPTGVLAADGRLLSEPVGARTALLVPRDGTARVAALRFHGRVAGDGASRLLDGVDRNRGRIPACGGRGGDRPTQRVDPATTCADASELVLLTPAFGDRTRTAPGGVEATIEDGVVRSVRRAADSPIPENGSVLTGSGDAARFLLDHLAPGAEPDVSLRVGGVDPAGYAAIVGGAPRLLRDGRVRITAAREGRGADTARAPRTIAGVRADGTVLLITIDGRQPEWSLGATLREAARTARALGATSALSLDSGGSTAMVVGHRVVNRPSDGAERAVADGLFVMRGRGARRGRG